jgi:hypothetical protein
MFRQKYLTAEDFETLVDRMVDEAPYLTKGEVAIELYRQQERYNKEQQAKARKQLTQLRKQAIKIMENYGCKS